MNKVMTSLVFLALFAPMVSAFSFGEFMGNTVNGFQLFFGKVVHGVSLQFNSDARVITNQVVRAEVAQTLDLSEFRAGLNEYNAAIRASETRTIAVSTALKQKAAEYPGLPKGNASESYAKKIDAVVGTGSTLSQHRFAEHLRANYNYAFFQVNHHGEPVFITRLDLDTLLMEEVDSVVEGEAIVSCSLGDAQRIMRQLRTRERMRAGEGEAFIRNEWLAGRLHIEPDGVVDELMK